MFLKGITVIASEVSRPTPKRMGWGGGEGGGEK